MREVIKVTFLSLIVMAVCGVSQMAVAAPPALMGDHNRGAYGFRNVQGDGYGSGHLREKRRNRADGGEARRGNMRERFKNLPPEKQQELQQKREQLRQELMALSPEERAQRIEQMRQEMLQRNKSNRQERMERMDERWKGASGEERKAFCDKAKEKCAAEGGFVCDAVKARCADK